MKMIYDTMRGDKRMRCPVWAACMAVVLSLAACTADDGVVDVRDEPAVVYPELHLCVSSMEMSAVSRAAEPMTPEEENYVKTLAVFEFDNEGLHVKGDNTYHFIDFLNGTVDGVMSDGDDVKKTDLGIIETTLKGISLEEYTDGTICLVANVTEEQVQEFYDKYREPEQTYGRMTFDKFKTWALPFEYDESPADRYDESTAGHLANMYMFGYYQGPIVPAESEGIYVDLGRLASRLDITIVNETGKELDKRLGYHFDNVCNSAYFFPGKMGMPTVIGAGMTRTVICSGKDYGNGDSAFKVVPRTFPNGKSHTRYFYTAAHSAANIDQATSLHLFYDRTIVKDDPNDDSKSVRIPMCNVHPSEAADVYNGFSLSRNTRYYFTIHLKNTAVASLKTRADRPVVEYGEQPGEITVYLP